MHEEGGEEARPGLEDDYKVCGWRTPPQTRAQTTAVWVAGDGAGARHTSAEGQGRGGEGPRKSQRI